MVILYKHCRIFKPARPFDRRVRKVVQETSFTLDPAKLLLQLAEIAFGPRVFIGDISSLKKPPPQKSIGDRGASPTTCSAEGVDWVHRFGTDFVTNFMAGAFVLVPNHLSNLIRNYNYQKASP